MTVGLFHFFYSAFANVCVCSCACACERLYSVYFHCIREVLKKVTVSGFAFSALPKFYNRILYNAIRNRKFAGMELSEIGKSSGYRRSLSESELDTQRRREVRNRTKSQEGEGI